ncbi:hypothetical protein BH11BAC7_BH11BAC7_14250 [soil metagenome]
MESRELYLYKSLYGFYKIYVTKTSQLLYKDLQRSKRVHKKKWINKPFEHALFDILAHSVREVAQERFDKYFNNSTFIFLYSAFESDLRQACSGIQREKNYKLGIKDLDGANYIEKSHKFLTKVAELDLAAYNKDWKELRDYQAIRNLIAHNASFLPVEKHNESVGKIILNNPYMQFDEETNVFHISDIKFLLDFCDTAAQYLDNIANEYEKISPKINPLDNTESSDSFS